MKTFQRMPTQGVFNSAPPDSIDASYAADGTNVRFRFNSVFNRPGTTAIATIASQPLYFERFFTDTSGVNVNFTVMLTDTGLFKLVGSSWVQITTLDNAGAAGAIPGSGNRFTTAIGESKFFFTRKGMNNVQSWDGSAGTTVRVADSSTQRGFPGNIVPGARFLEYFNNRLLEAYINNPNEQSTRVNFSRSGITGDWDSTLGGGFLDLNTGAMGDEQAEPCTGIQALAGRLTYYKRHAILDMTPTGTTAPVFTSEVRVRGIGCAAPYTLANAGQTHIFLGDDNVYAWDGISLRAIGDPIQKELLGLMDSTQFNAYFAGITPERQEYYLVMQNGNIFVYDYLRDYWVHDSYPQTSSVFISALGEADRGTTAFTWTGGAGITGTWLQHNESWDKLNIAGVPALLGAGPQGVSFGTFYQDNAKGTDYDGSSPAQSVYTKQFYANEDPTNMQELTRVMFRYGINNGTVTGLSVFAYLATGLVTQAITFTPNVSGGYSFVDFTLSGTPLQFVFGTTGGTFEWQSFSYETTTIGQPLGL